MKIIFLTDGYNSNTFGFLRHIFYIGLGYMTNNLDDIKNEDNRSIYYAFIPQYYLYNSKKKDAYHLVSEKLMIGCVKLFKKYNIENILNERIPSLKDINIEYKSNLINKKTMDSNRDKYLFCYNLDDKLITKNCIKWELGLDKYMRLN